MDTHARLRRLLDERGWTAYRLAKESGLSESTLANIFKLYAGLSVYPCRSFLRSATLSSYPPS